MNNENVNPENLASLLLAAKIQSLLKSRATPPTPPAEMPMPVALKTLSNPIDRLLMLIQGK